MSAKEITVALWQASSGDELPANLARAGQAIDDAGAAGAQLVCLPELFTCMSAESGPKREAAKPENVDKAQKFLADAASKHKIHLAGGSICCTDGKALRNRSLLYGPDGKLLASYDKIHLFRFHGPDRSYDESVDYEPGKDVVTCATELGRIGLSVCYDLRFPELYRKMDRPDIILVPAAFTHQTGKAHWELLLRSRAVENQCHVIGTAQCGEHPGPMLTWGHSMIVDPWGEVVAALGDEPEVLISSIDLQKNEAVRKRLPALDNRML